MLLVSINEDLRGFDSLTLSSKSSHTAPRSSSDHSSFSSSWKVIKKSRRGKSDAAHEILNAGGLAGMAAAVKKVRRAPAIASCEPCEPNSPISHDQHDDDAQTTKYRHFRARYEQAATQQSRTLLLISAGGDEWDDDLDGTTFHIFQIAKPHTGSTLLNCILQGLLEAKSTTRHSRSKHAGGNY